MICHTNEARHICTQDKLTSYFKVLILSHVESYISSIKISDNLSVRIMQAACDVAFKYAHERTAFGKKIGEFQVFLLSSIVSNLVCHVFRVNNSLNF